MMNQVRERAAELTERAVEVVLGAELWRPDMMEEEARAALGI
jgi:metal-sulfur cluster biosynthetic enzyme